MWAMSGEWWDQEMAEDLVSDFCADLKKQSRNGLPLDPGRAEEANMGIREGLAVEDADLLERALLDAQVAWCEAPAEGYQPPELEDFDE